MQYIDSHAHLSDPAVFPQIHPILRRAQEAHVTHVLNICTDPLTLKEGFSITAQYPWVQNAGATTPHDVAQEGEEAFACFETAAQEQRLVAVGETGLDYHYEHSPKAIQQTFFVRYLHLAAATHLPVIFHCRDSFADLFAIADLEYPRNAPAIVHCFTGNRGEAEQALERGWFLSFSGIVTFKKSEALRAVAPSVPLSQLLIETDTPYLAPQTRRGTPNEPSFLPEIAQCLAQAKGIDVEALAAASTANAKRLFFSPQKNEGRVN